MSRRARRLGAGLTVLALTVATLGACTDEAPYRAEGTAAVEGTAVLDPWFDAVRGDGDDAADVVVLGDSVSEGAGMSTDLERRWVDRLQAKLRQRSGTADCPTGPGGWHGTTSLVPATYRAGTLPDPVVRGRATLTPTLGPGGRGVGLQPGASVSWQVEAESVDIGYRTRFSGGAFQVRIDGEIPLDGLAVPTDADGGAERRTWSSGDLGPGTHTVTVVNDQPRSTGRRAVITDLMPYRGDRDRCVHVLDSSRAGVRASTIAQTPAYLRDALSLDPDLLLVPLGFNDQRAGHSARQFGESLDGIIRQSRAMGYEGPILVVGWFPPERVAGQADWDDYLSVMRGRTRHEGVSFIDLSPVLPAADPDSSYFLDGLHPSARAQPLMAEALADVLAPTPDGTPTASSPATTSEASPDPSQRPEEPSGTP
ncbi:GDSL-type esterase/lipase family protein [Janibacter indicus]|uniref:SGNH/GDSL hydrolase family protein n=1 Tax=Janibacter indicus TaxID=857417 RepID=UPI003D9A2007